MDVKVFSLPAFIIKTVELKHKTQTKKNKKGGRQEERGRRRNGTFKEKRNKKGTNLHIYGSPSRRQTVAISYNISMQ
jgi:hypothetical protein